ncbi:MAG TPA: hypothetical protein VGO03_17145 [Acidimicrobiia bacterium]|jgi:hypothetical protein
MLTASDTERRPRDASTGTEPDVVAPDIVVAELEPAQPATSRRDRERRRRRRWHRRVVLACLVALLAVPAWSLGHALVAHNTDPLRVRVVEWARDHHLAGVVNGIENYWYTHHPPKRGGTPKGGIPRVAVAAAPVTTAVTAAPVVVNTSIARPVSPPAPPPYAPANLRPFVTNSLVGEGVWQPAGRPVNGAPAAWVSYLRPDAVHTSELVGLAYFDMHHLTATLHEGTQLPGGGPWLHGARIDPSDYARIVGAFNSGFTLKSSKGGWYADGRTIAPLVPGRASIVTYRDGRADIAMWGRDATMTPDVTAVRQNLDLLIDGGKIATDVGSNWVWGGTLGNEVLVWRSGVGINMRGDLIYAGGPGLSVASLAAVLQRAGAVRSMELDINSYWVSAMTFTAGPTGAPVPRKLLANMSKPASIYLENQTRDFVELDAR